MRRVANSHVLDEDLRSHAVILARPYLAGECLLRGAGSTPLCLMMTCRTACRVKARGHLWSALDLKRIHAWRGASSYVLDEDLHDDPVGRARPCLARYWSATAPLKTCLP